MTHTPTTAQTPLVSIVVITYNSGAYILETLDSILQQTYQNLELIVTDDCSKDHTVSLCREWLATHQARFVRTHLVTTPTNSGISANCNRGLKEAKGEWVKFLAGDDLLLPCYTQQQVGYATAHPQAKLIFSKLIGFNPDSPQPIDLTRTFLYHVFGLSQRAFTIRLLHSNFIPAPTALISQEVFATIGNFDEEIPMLEDWPFWMKAACHGYRFHLLDEANVRYRIHSQSVSNGAISPIYQRSLDLTFQKSLALQKTRFPLLWLERKMKPHKVLKPLRLINPYYYYVKFITHKSRYRG